MLFLIKSRVDLYEMELYKNKINCIGILEFLFIMTYKIDIVINMKSTNINEFYRLKFISPYTKFPVRLKDNFGYLKNTEWFKYGSNCLVDQLDYFKNYFSFENQINDSRGSELNLLITDFNNQSFSLLDHYEPRHDQLDNFHENDREIYSIVYMSKFNPKIEDKNDKIELSCFATFIYPVDLADEHGEILIEELFNSVEISLKIHENFRQKRLVKNTNHRVRRTTNRQSVHEIDFLEGPITFYKETLDKELTMSCGIKILDYDGTYALNHVITHIIETNYKTQEIVASSISFQKGSSNFIFILTIFSLICQLMSKGI